MSSRVKKVRTVLCLKSNQNVVEAGQESFTERVSFYPVTSSQSPHMDRTFPPQLIQGEVTGTKTNKNICWTSSTNGQ